jgi:hypothetical protein
MTVSGCSLNRGYDLSLGNRQAVWVGANKQVKAKNLKDSASSTVKVTAKQQK